jgi:intein/homing endonuclease
MKIYTYNTEFLKSWSEDMSYFLGFTTADGCISKELDRITYGLNAKDISILEFIRDKICPEKPIILSHEKRKETICSTVRLKLFSTEIAKLLSQYHIIPQKTGKEKLPYIPEAFKKDYLRGLFDGDGCVSIPNKKKQLKFSIVSASEEFLIEVRDTLGFGLGTIFSKKTCYSWTIYKQKDVEKIYNFMYNTKSFYLKRKKDIFLRRFEE